MHSETVKLNPTLVFKIHVNVILHLCLGLQSQLHTNPVQVWQWWSMGGFMWGGGHLPSAFHSVKGSRHVCTNLMKWINHLLPLN